MDLSKRQVGASSSSSSSSSSTHSFTHDVFLSFRGPDTRNNFTGHLHLNLLSKGIKTFIDDGLPKGEDIKNELLKVIERSKISVVVFSANYAFSKWCLNELVKILQCKESQQQIVYPIFYKIHPSKIRYQKDQIGDGIDHLSTYEDNLTKVGSWKAALTQAGDFAGWHIEDGEPEANVIEQIVKEISTKIMKCIPLDVATYPVGIESRVEHIRKLLNIGQVNPHMVGIYGIGGIGKTTLAKAVYNSISHEFEHSCFLKDVRVKSREGLVQLQNKFLSKIIERNPHDIADDDEGIIVLKQSLNQKRVLLVLDDVDRLEQLRKLVGCDWFGPSSRIIITTRDINLLNAHGIGSRYEVKELNDEEALELFIFNAFKENKSKDDFFELATEVIRYAKGIPLVLEVLGSDLCSKNKAEWEDALAYHSKHPHGMIQQTLKRSYEALDHLIKEVFLHIACFFKGDEKSYVIDVLQSCGLPTYALQVLVEKTLIKIVKGSGNENEIWMHDLLEDMGKEIVWQESPDEAGKRSRLWLYEDVREVLEENMGTDEIKAIVLRRVNNSQKIRLNGRSFTNLKKLEIFKVDGYKMLCGEGVDYLPNQLRVLGWDFCPLRSLPKNFNPTKLGILSMDGPYVIPLIKGLTNMRYLKSLKLTDFGIGYDDETIPNCFSIQRRRRIPDLSGLTSLEYLELFYCRDLVEVHPSVGRLDKLVTLRVRACAKLQMFPKVINLKSLKILDLSFCPQLKFFPEVGGDMKSLETLNLRRTAIKELPCSVGNLTGLKSLSLEGCKNLTNVPSSIFYGLQCLEDLDLTGCSNLVTFPTKSESLPPPVFSTNLTSRLQVHLNDCKRLEEISEFPRDIDGLYVRGCGSLERISKLSKILEGKDSKMFGWLGLTDCPRLCDNLVRGVVSGVEVDKRLFHLAKKRNEMTSSQNEGSEELMGEAEKLTALLTLFFSCPDSEEFQVGFPASAPIPNWFTFPQDVNWYGNSEQEFYIKIPQNSNWDNKGLALCIQPRYIKTFFLYINGIKFGEKNFVSGNEVWVHYIPFVTVIKRLSESGMPPPDMFRVMFRLENILRCGGSCGVHLIKDLEEEGR